MYCITVPGLTPADAPLLASIVANGDHNPGGSSVDFSGLSGDIVSVDIDGTGTEISYAAWNPGTLEPICEAGQFEVRTWTSFSGEMSDDVVWIDRGSYDDQDFSFLVP